jgi:hypothetical protein
MVEKVKFTQITRTICPKTGVHYLDAVDTEGQIWFAEMQVGIERWLVFTSPWKKMGQVPYK